MREDIGITTQLPTGSVRRVQWRVGWTHWPFAYDQPHSPERVYDNEAEARQHLDGLRSIQADHPMDGPCDIHIWRPTLDRRTVWEGPWTAAGPAMPQQQEGDP
jgi:hypothetical protein